MPAPSRQMINIHLDDGGSNYSITPIHTNDSRDI